MVEFVSAKLCMHFNAVSTYDTTLSLKIYHDDRVWQWQPMPEGKTIWCADIVFPTKIILEFDGRTDKNTIVDEHNNIISDRKVIIENLTLDKLPCWEYWLDHKILQKCTDGREIQGRHVCGNGRIEIDFNEPNSFVWLAKSKLVS